MTLTYQITPYGSVSAGYRGAQVGGDSAQLCAWAGRPDASWPCSELKMLDWIRVEFAANGDLVGINSSPDDTTDLSADELSAWTTDVLRAAGLGDHPAVR